MNTRPNNRLDTDLRTRSLRSLASAGQPSALCGVVLKSYMTILHCLANEIYLELLG
jgi:hypothetical protein